MNLRFENALTSLDFPLRPHFDSAPAPAKNHLAQSSGNHARSNGPTACASRGRKVFGGDTFTNISGINASSIADWDGP
jgi:hypothetical protein